MVTIQLPDESYERASERAAELGVDVETFIAAAIDVFASRVEFKGERTFYEERLARIGPDIDQAVERWLYHAPTSRDGRTGHHRDL